MARNPISRMIIGGLMAYALIVHALIMGIVSAPVSAQEGDLIAQLQVICTSAPHSGSPEVPVAPAAHQQHCALCGVGHAILPEAQFASTGPQSLNLTAWAPIAGERLLIQARLDHHQPRAPPFIA